MNQFKCYGNTTTTSATENRPFMSDTSAIKARLIGGVPAFQADNTAWTMPAPTCCVGANTVKDSTDMNDLGYKMYQLACLFITAAVLSILASLALFAAHVAYNIDPTPSSVPKAESQLNFSPI